MRKRIAVAVLAGTLSLACTVPAFADQWRKDNRGWWYQLNDGSYPQSSWKQINGKWYYFESDGYMKTGWLQDASGWYYLGSDGGMCTGWVQVDNSWYYFDRNGRMAQNTWVNGYWLDDDGEWQPDYEPDATGNDWKKTETQTQTYETQTAANKAAENKVVQSGTGSVTITGHQSMEGTYDVGTSVPMIGIITSSDRVIKSVTVDLKTVYLGDHHQKKTYEVNTNTVDLSTLDLGELDTRYLTMSGAGYSYTVNITYQSGETKEIFKEYFKMKYERKATYSMENYIALPERVMEGTDYRVNGVIQANYPISSIWVSIKQISSGKETICENPQPFTYSYDLSDIADKFDFSSLEEGTYNYTIRVYIGAQAKTICNQDFKVQKDYSKTATVYTVNSSFDIRDDGSMLITNGSRPFYEKVIGNAASRMNEGYRNGHKYVKILWKKDKSDVRTNHVYAHSFGKVVSVEEDTVTIQYGNGYQTKYEGLKTDEIYVKAGDYVDENTTVGVIPENKSVTIYLYNNAGEELNIKDYLDYDF